MTILHSRTTIYNSFPMSFWLLWNKIILLWSLSSIVQDDLLQLWMKMTEAKLRQLLILSDFGTVMPCNYRAPLFMNGFTPQNSTSPASSSKIFDFCWVECVGFVVHIDCGYREFSKKKIHVVNVHWKKLSLPRFSLKYLVISKQKDHFPTI